MNQPEILGDEELEIGRRAVEDVLIEFRDSRVSRLGSSGLVVEELDGTYSSIIRLGIADALRIGFKAINKTGKYISREQHKREMREQAEEIRTHLEESLNRAKNEINPPFFRPSLTEEHDNIWRGYADALKDVIQYLSKYLTPSQKRENTCASCGKPIEPGQDFVDDPLRHSGDECANKERG